VARWLILAHRIPARPLYLRAKIRQRLAAAGALAVKNAVYLLPRSDEGREDLEWIAQEIVASGGDAHLFEGEFADPRAANAAIAQFRDARAAEYHELTQHARAAVKRARTAPGSHSVAQVHDRLAQRLDQVRRLDAFEANGRAAAEQAVAAIAGTLARGHKQEGRMRSANPDLKGRTWVTRPGVKVDRIASAWFIRRFIDAKARFRFDDPQQPRRNGDLRFDMVGGDFTHDGDRCTFETLVRRVGMPGPGVRAIAEIVHDIDLKDGKFGRAETAGVAAAIDGLVRRHAKDRDRLAHGLALFDDLHEAFASAKRAQK
jgi:hypothetical protein